CPERSEEMPFGYIFLGVQSSGARDWKENSFHYKTSYIEHFITFSMGGFKKWVSACRYSDKRYKIC
ncbi:MAG: hypothetical protein KAH72_07065, partial [Flavobacteriaceae bacterium]|nr:hypothetical protein [Flavobacteriaceae bacterium]